MRRAHVRVGAGLFAAVGMAAALGVAASPASAQPTGLTFYSTPFSVEVLHLAAPTGECAPLPATAAGHVGWSGFTNVVLYRTADCTGQATSTGTLRTYDAGRFTSFVAY
ncbi:hypothetical protein [Plantactinospora sp. KLBMP9567]|uniref:hypothetical protein n=1 Tax=Plantactinospora sp. KLBMP9567 TaxID=3085900 RepID=UPI0029811C35|nr:hypothetical protein [Plantactinospora sp. KLBMP9567]MDW5330500.1 hypothetical protein [Plantactinospora sp. KLBMP9567]